MGKRIEQDGFRLEEEHCFLDDGYSGSTLLRPALERLRDLVHCGGVDRLYVHSPDRLSRKYVYQMLLLEEFSRQGAQVHFLNHDPQHQSAEGNLLLQMQGMIAEYERYGDDPRHSAQSSLHGYGKVRKNADGCAVPWASTQTG